ncbi:unnamed protein product [Caenorhabditis auriculariae]|uniref:Uncharacterized protein n=1 Tax=Caenorhabditis auriculariae TaxID=2777116 RepID=A0A8S1GQ85_9PELO|nr:unnamed protein product [Caenorhabditis auriculariae]
MSVIDGVYAGMDGMTERPAERGCHTDGLKCNRKPAEIPPGTSELSGSDRLSGPSVITTVEAKAGKRPFLICTHRLLVTLFFAPDAASNLLPGRPDGCWLSSHHLV